MKLPPIIAIYGVGNHKPGEVQALLSGAFGRADLIAAISELNWDKLSGLTVQSVPDGVRLLNNTAQSISETARLPLMPMGGKIDRLLHIVEEFVYLGVFLPLVALGLCILVVGPPLWLLVLLASSTFHSITLENLAWARLAANAVLITAACVALVLFVVALLRSLVTRAVQPVWVVLRRVALLLMQPVILLLTVPFSWRLGSPAVRLFVNFLPMALISAALNLILSPLNGYEIKRLIADFGVGFLVVIAITGSGWVQLCIRRFWINGPLKVTLDIVRYMGDPQYRSRLQRELDQHIEALPAVENGPRSVVLYAHSLGSVIALDSLFNSSAWKAEDDVQLVTLGSPIKRSFMRLFPTYLFPPSVERAAQAVASRVGRFSWINLHRRWDYVGTRLGLDRAGVGVDLCTGQGWRVLRSHSNYWSDDVVVRKLLSGLEAVRPVSGTPLQPAESQPLIPTARTMRVQVRLAKGVRAAAIALFVIVLGTAVVKFINSRSTWIERVDKSALEVRQTGVQALAAVTYYRTTEGGGEDTYYLHHFGIRLPQPLGERAPIEIPDNEIYGEYSSRFDYKALAKHILDSCTPAAIKPWWQVFRSRLSIPCTRTEIQVRYDTRYPERIYFPQFPARRTFGTGAAQMLGSVLLGFLIALGCALVVFGCAVPLLLWFLGLNAGMAKTDLFERIFNS